MIRLTAEKILLVMVLLTVGALVFREPLLEKRIVIGPGAENIRLELDSDFRDGGTSKTEWIDKDNFAWRCQLEDTFDYPYCGMQIYFSDSYLKGIDLSNYTHLNISLDYKGEAESFRIYFRNSNTHYTRPNEIRSTKFNVAELDTRRSHLHEDIQLSHFRVADWWLILYDLEMAYTQIEFTNIGLIEIQTGTGLKAGDHTFRLNKLELVGVRISLEQMYLCIIVIWLFAILVFLASRIRILQMAVRTGEKRHAELTEVHALLDRRHRTLEQKIKLDPLTGAYNRAGIEQPLTRAFHKWKLEKKPLSLLLFDVDNFKDVNDKKGHAIGDSVLRELTLLVSENIRDDDHFARWGGEEFIIVCGDTELTQARELAEKLRKKIDGSVFADKLHVTVSFGVAQIRKGETLSALFNRTDEALYIAKNKGRNQVTVSDDTKPEEPDAYLLQNTP